MRLLIVILQIDTTKWLIIEYIIMRNNLIWCLVEWDYFKIVIH